MQQDVAERNGHESPCAALQVVIERTEHLERWEQGQNGHLRDINEKIDRLMMWMLAAAGAAVVSLALLIVNLLANSKP